VRQVSAHIFPDSLVYRKPLSLGFINAAISEKFPLCTQIPERSQTRQSQFPANSWWEFSGTIIPQIPYSGSKPELLDAAGDGSVEICRFLQFPPLRTQIGERPKDFPRFRSQTAFLMLPQIWSVNEFNLSPLFMLKIVEKLPNFPHYHSSHKSRMGGNVLGTCREL